MKKQPMSSRQGTPILSSRPARLLMLVALLASLLCIPPSAAASASRTMVVRSDAGGTVLEVHAPEYQIVEKAIDGGACQMIDVQGLGQMDGAGQPMVPVQGAMLGLPPGAAAQVHVLQADFDTITLPGDLCPVPAPVMRDQPGPDGGGPGEARVEMVYTQDGGAYATDAFYPAVLAASTGEAHLRDQRVLQLSLRPFQYNPVSRELRVYRTLRVEVSFSYPQGQQGAGSGGEIGGPFETTLEHAIVNYDVARQWRETSTAPIPSLPMAAPTALTGLSQGYKVAVNQDGLHQLTYADLAAAGLPVETLDPRTFQLFDRGQELAIQVSGQEDGQFGPEDAILFYGEGMDTKYTDTNVYWLLYGATTGRRMGSRDASPTGAAPVPSSFAATTHQEENLRYVARYPEAQNADHWFWNYTYPPSVPTRTYNFALASTAAEPYTATLRMRLIAGTTLVHGARAYLNGYPVAETAWEGIADLEFGAEFHSSYLQEGDNTLVVEGLVPSGFSYDFFYIDWFEVDYRRQFQAEADLLAFSGDAAGAWQFEVGGFTHESALVYDVTDSLSPVSLTGHTMAPVSGTYTLAFEESIAGATSYLALDPGRILSPLNISADAPSSLRSPDNGADYLVITHADFYAQAQQLANYRQGQQGIARARVVDVQDIYDEFNDGELSAEAIHQFLQYAYDT